MRRYIITALKISLVLYLSILFLLLFVRYRGSWWMDVTPFEYAKMHMNLIPFKTIGGYVAAIFDGSMNLNIPLENLLGNLFLFFPLGIYLPLFGKREDTLKNFLCSTVSVIFIIEFAQFLTKRGSFDIDDFILNLAGALLGYLIWRSRIVQNLVEKIK